MMPRRNRFANISLDAPDVMYGATPELPSIPQVQLPSIQHAQMDDGGDMGQQIGQTAQSIRGVIDKYRRPRFNPSQVSQIHEAIHS